MLLVLSLATLYLLLYAPGHYLLSGRSDGQPHVGSQLLREVMLSAACTSWVGLILAEIGVFSLWALLGVLAIVSLAARGRRRLPAQRYRRADCVGIGIVVLGWIWVAPPLDTRILGSDSAGYLAAGVHLSRHGSLVIHDPTLPLLSPDLKRTLFPSVAPDRGSPPYLRLLGSMVLRSLDSDEVLPAFHHLIVVWIAVFHDVGGSYADEWAITLFAGLSLWAIVEFAATVGGSAVALMCGALLLFLSPQYWYSRFLMPEVPGQFFVWAGLCCLLYAHHSGRRTDGLLAGIAFGIAGLMRVENAAFLLLAVAVTVALSPSSARRPVVLLLAAALPLWLHAAVHLSVLRTHYFGNLQTLFAENLPSLSPSSALVAIGVVVGATAILLSRSAQSGTARRTILVYFAVVIGAASIALWTDFQRGGSSLGLLIFYGGFPTLIGGGIGLWLTARNVDSHGLAYRLFLLLAAIVFAQVVLAPHATPVPIWAVRRSVTVVLPGLCLGLALLCRLADQRIHWSLGLAVFGIGIIAQAPPLLELRREPYFQDALRHVQTIAALIPAGSRVLYDGNITASALAPTLWAERDLPAYLVAPSDLARIRELLNAFGESPVYWINDGAALPPHGAGVVATPVAHYEFILSTPSFDVESVPTGAGVNWDYGVGIYVLRVTTD